MCVGLMLGCAGAGQLLRPAPATEPAATVEDPPKCDRTGGERILDMDFAGRSTEVQVFAPRGTEPVDAVVLLHGGGGNRGTITAATGAEALAAREGFVLVVPEGQDQGEHGHRWSSGKYDPMPVPRDDVAYLDQLAQRVRSSLCVDRVLVFGFSNGSQMAQRWACESTAVDAVATAAGSLFVDPSTCVGPVPFRAWVGSDDLTYDPDRGRRRGPGEKHSFADNLETYRARNRCGDDLTARDRATERKTTCTTWECEVPLVSCEVEGFGHGVPHDREGLGADAAADAWAWFESLPRERRDGS